jgi:serine/threonine protein kinase
MQRTRRKNKKQKTKRKRRRGGEVVGTGTYGCVFRPRLKCKITEPVPPNKDVPPKKETRKISKLMTKEAADAEMKEIDKIKLNLEEIENFEKYFVINDIDECIPDKLVQSDMDDFNAKCEHLGDATYVNNNLHEFRLLNIPDGGDNMSDVILNIEENNFPDHHNVNVMHSKLIELLQYAIIPMNYNNVYHCDIKAANIVYNYTTEEIKLIDWGWAMQWGWGRKAPLNESPPDIPEQFEILSLFYNFPFGTILFQKAFQIKYAKFLQNTPTVTNNILFNFLVDCIYDQLERDEGRNHISIIDTALKTVIVSLESQPATNINHTTDIHYDNYNWTINIIARYLVPIVQRYSTNMLKYFNERFLNDIDVWGFLSTFLIFLIGNPSGPYSNKIRHLVYQHMFQPSTNPIQVHNVLRDLKRIQPQESKRKNKDDYDEEEHEQKKKRK